MGAQRDADEKSAIISIFQEQIPGFSLEFANRSFERLEIDSLGLLLLRFGIERFLGFPVEDRIWTSLTTPAELFATVLQLRRQSAGLGDGTARREYMLNMPQMALGGLSEFWLFKELGDLHWSIICAGLRAASSEIRDGNGDRLYATFTRVRWSSSHSLAVFAENEALSLHGKMSRFGAGMFVSNIGFAAGEKSGRAMIMSSFTKRGSLHSNAGLLKGQPSIPPGCAIEALSELPSFAIECAALRRQRLATPLFECEYEIIPWHDINGVGLLYFAAYPIISDICELRYIGEGKRWAGRASTVNRDVFYFANADLEERLIYRVHARRDGPGWVEIDSSLSRGSDDTLMAYIVTRKSLLQVAKADAA